jgi:hypothetical protein
MGEKVMDPKITVLMSVYNAERYLHEAMDSILNQTFKDYEFVIVNDGSTDGTLGILQGYRDPRIRIINNPQNIGLTQSLNEALKSARGEYIARQDADDISLPDRLARQLRFMQTHPEVGGAGSWAEFIDPQGERIRRAQRPTEHDEICAHLLIYNPFIHTSAFIRKQTLEEVGGYREDLRYAQDYDLWWRLAQVGRVTVIPRVLVKRRKHTPGGIAEQHTQEQVRFECQIACQIVEKQIGLKGHQLESYKHLFWALHGHPEHWQGEDTRLLRPLWEYLARRPAYRRVWGPLVTKSACRVMAHNPREGIQLAWVAFRDLRWPRVWPEFLKTCGRLYVPLSVVRTVRWLRRTLLVPYQ